MAEVQDLELVLVFGIRFFHRLVRRLSDELLCRCVREQIGALRSQKTGDLRITVQIEAPSFLLQKLHANELLGERCLARLV